MLLINHYSKDALTVAKQALFGKRTPEIDKKTHANV